MICNNLEIKNGTLYFGGNNTVEIARQYKTPLYVMDEPTIRANCRRYVRSMKKYFGESALPLYASKACSFMQMYRIVFSEGMGADVVSSGELYTAVKAGVDTVKLYYHSNSKNDEDIEFAIRNGIGCIVIDNLEELDSVERIAGEFGVKQKIIIRITPGIDTHTYEAVNTGKVDSKFGFPLETGEGERITLYALTLKNIDFAGFHCHIGSQLFDSDVFIRSADIMLNFIAEIKAKTGFEARELDLGGGYGVRYVETDPEIDIEANICEVAEFYNGECARLGLNPPAVRMEPGRSIVADAGITLYTVGNVKRIEGYKNYTAVDGGMGDNPRYALYGAEYTAIAANKAEEPCSFKSDLVGRFCESGDIVEPDVLLPESICRGDIIAVLTTGAYNYSMASNYNRIARPPVVMLNGGESYVAVKRESLDDLVANDV